MAAARDVLLLIDGHALVYRAFFAMPALTNSRGEMTNAAFGFTSMLLKVFSEHHPSHAIAAFDPPGPTFRHEQDASYKAQRPEMPEALRPQVGWCREIVEALGIPRVELPRFEADDVIGSLSRQAELRDTDVLILTGDLDALQLVSDRVHVYASRRGITDTIVYDVARVHERYGFDPPLVVDLKALQGDVTDNIPGVPGIGAKTAMALIQEHGTLESILAAVPGMPEGKLKRLLTEHREQALRSKQMATIVRDLDVALDLEGARLGGHDPEAVRQLFDRLEFRSLLARLPPPAAARAAGDVTAGPPPPGGSGQGELSLVAGSGGKVAPDPASEARVRPAEVRLLREASELGSLAAAAPAGLALRTVCAGPARQGHILGLALAPLADPGAAAYLPVGAGSGDGGSGALEAAAALLSDPGVTKWGYDLKQDVLAWAARGVTVQGLGLDLMLAAYLGLSSRTRVPGLVVLAEDLCGIRGSGPEDIAGSGRGRRDPAEIPVDEMAAHAGALVALVGPVGSALEGALAEGEGRLRALHDELELPLVPILAAMELRGIAVDRTRLDGLSRELTGRIGELEAEVQAVAGEPFNIGSTQQLARFLYDQLGLAAGRRTKTGRSTDADTLELLREEHPVVARILEWRQLTKLRGTYVDALPLLRAEDGRIHSSFNQAVATTGRLSSADPNLQNVPIRTVWGQRIREAFVAAEGSRLVSADYSQIELRLLAHLSGEPELVEAFHRGEDIHRRTAAEVCGVTPELVTPEMRRNAKVVNFGVIYGLSDFGLSRDTGMSREEARAFIDAYFASFPAVTAYLERVRQHAREWGWVETLMGRRRHFPDIRAANRQLRQAAERMAVNMPLQGGAADIMKLAMIRADRALRQAGLSSQLVLQVHDELVLEAPEAEIEALVPLLREAMGGATQLAVPLEVDVKLGGNWKAMTPV